ncbi:MAG: hypothetical protein B7733_25465 [Myxococcales bacterium FL481]|nr:MAG: hypothetical protein B7733_25465 [Myxococcales bacterium FL481]
MRLAWGLGGFALGVAATSASVAVGGARPPGDRRGALYAVVDTIFARYVEPLDADRVLAPAIQRLVGELDPHSSYLTAEQRRRAQQLRGANTDAGLHVRLAVRGAGQRHLEVVGVRPDSLPWRAGVRPGDHLLRIGPRGPASFLNQADVELALAGQPGTRHHLWVVSQGGGEPWPLELELVARNAQRDVEAHVMRRAEGTYLLVAIRSFVTGVGAEVRELLTTHRLEVGPHGFAGIVLDLRGNPGGLVDEALVVADLFVADGVLTRTRGRDGKVLREERAHAAGTDRQTPLVIIQDRTTGSSAELLTAALRDHGRARVVGEQSYGKGTVQDVMGLSDGSLLTLTIARYYAPSGTPIDGVGVTPDRPLLCSDTGGADRCLAGAIKDIADRADRRGRASR